MILFYDDKSPYYEFCNFYPSEIEYKGRKYQTSEHAYQSQKFTNNIYYLDLVANSDTPNKCFSLANQKKGRFTSKWFVNKNIYGSLTVNEAIDNSLLYNFKPIENWENLKDQIMFEIVYCKFSQNLRLKEILLNTGDQILVENSPRDNYWGIGSEGNGQNKLGKILMYVRKLLMDQLFN